MYIQNVFVRHFASWVLVLVAGASMALSAFAGNGPEVYGSAGGITIAGGGGSHPIYGGGASIGLGDNLRVFGEINYNNIVSASVSGSNGSGSGSVHLLGAGGGVDYSFFNTESRVRPYVTGTVGLDHMTLNVSALGTNVGVSSNSLYYGGGGGLRYFIGKHWGVKPEVRYQRSVDTGNTLIYSVGLFYRFGN